MSLSQKSGYQEATRHRSFMSRVSSVLLPTRKPHSSKSKNKSQSDLLRRKKSSTSIEEKNDRVSFCSTEGYENGGLNEEPGYSSISDLNGLHRNAQKEEPPPPPVPPKSLEDLYSTVKKKETRETSCNTEEADFPVCELEPEEQQQKTNFAETCRKVSSAQINDETIRDIVPIRNENYTDGIYNIDAAKKLHDRKSRLGKQNIRHRTNKSHKSISHAEPQAVNFSPHLPSCSHTKKSHTHRENLITKPLESSLFDDVTSEKYSFHETINKVKQKHREELLHLREEMQHTDKENAVLRAKLANLLEQEQKWKQDITKAKLHEQEHLNAIETNAELNRRIAKLEIDTKQEIQLLCQQIKTIRHEKDLVVEQLQASQRDNQSLQKMYNNVFEENKSMISAERHVRTLEENKRFLEEMKKKHEQDVDKLHQMYAAIEDEKNMLSIQALTMKEEQKRLQAENSQLRKKLVEMDVNNVNMVKQLHDMKQQQNEALDLLVSLLKTAEEVMMERDAILKKSQMQDYQHKMIHTSVIQHSINVGRLEEHITNLRKRMNEEITKVAMSKHDKELDYNYMKESYERQLDFLRTKILQKNGSLDIMDKEKRKLELDLENLWEATIMQKRQTHNGVQWNQFSMEKLNNSS